MNPENAGPSGEDKNIPIQPEQPAGAEADQPQPADVLDVQGDTVITGSSVEHAYLDNIPDTPITHEAPERPRSWLRSRIAKAGAIALGGAVLFGAAYNLGQNSNDAEAQPDTSTLTVPEQKPKAPVSEEGRRLRELLPEQVNKAMEDQGYKFDHYVLGWDGAFTAVFNTKLDSAGQPLTFTVGKLDGGRENPVIAALHDKQINEAPKGTSAMMGGVRIDPNVNDVAAGCEPFIVTPNNHTIEGTKLAYLNECSSIIDELLYDGGDTPVAPAAATETGD